MASQPSLQWNPGKLNAKEKRQDGKIGPTLK